MDIVIKRIYEPVDARDGKRILVDRLWPRGVSKEKAHLDGWFKDVAPSPDLRIWFGHEEARFEEFSERYLFELSSDSEKQPELKQLLDFAKNDTLTLLYAAKSPVINHAIVLKRFLEERLG